MKKTIETTDEGAVIHTVNGVDTKTGAIYVREIKTYTPLENGFNLELAQDILAQIRRTPLLWNQDVWRITFDLDQYPTDYLPDAVKNGSGFYEEVMGRTPVLEDLKELLDDVYQPNAKCGTAMCFAGWVAEMTAANFAIDGVLIKAKHVKLGREPLAEQDQQERERRELLNDLNYISDSDIFVTKEEAANYPLVMRFRGRYSPKVTALLAERGFSDDTHAVVGIADYAKVQLGLGDYDPAGLFHGYNTYGDLEKIVAAYAEYGPEANRPEDCGLGADDEND